MSYAFSLRYTPTTGLVHGGGWAGATAQPAAVGDSGAAGYGENAIARWDVVPYQTVAGTLGVGVVSFHIEGIASVKISIDGGPWVVIATPSLNPDTGVVEYWTAVEANRHADGIHELRAIAVPVSGVPRVLSGMYVNTNAGGTLAAPLARYVSPTGNDANDGLTAGAPMATTNAAAFAMQTARGGTNVDRCTVYLLGGDHTLSGAAFDTQSVTVNAWMTVEPAPGVARSAVRIVGTTGSGFNSKLIRFHNLTVTGGINSGGPTEDYCWLDGCAMVGTDTATSTPGVGSGWSAAYCTDSTFNTVAVGPQGYELVRNVTIDGIGGDAFSGSFLVVNGTVTNAAQVEGAHADLWQWVAAVANAIMYGVDNTAGIGTINSAGPLFEVSGRDVAVVNCNLSAGANPYSFYMTKAQRHVYVKGCAITGGYFTDGSLVATNVVYEGNTYSAGNPPGVTVR